MLAEAPTATPSPLVVPADPDGDRPCIVHVPGDDSTGSPHGVDGAVTVDPDPVSATLVWIPGLNDTPCAAQLTTLGREAASRLVDAVLAGPSIPAGAVYNCGGDDGGSVVVYFRYAQTAAAEAAVVQLSGCGWVVEPGRTSSRVTAALRTELRAAAPPRWAARLAT